MLVSREHPGNLAQIHAVLVLENAPGPDPGSHSVAAVDAHLPAFQVLGPYDAGLGIVHDGTMVKGAHQEDRECRELLPMGASGDVGRQRHFGNIELERAHHAAERVDERVDLLEVEFECPRLYDAALERLVVALRTSDGFKLELGHGRFVAVARRK